MTIVRVVYINNNDNMPLDLSVITLAQGEGGWGKMNDKTIEII
jgi:hypothetical protein